MKHYEAGTIIQRRDGYCFLKTQDGKLVAQHRWVAALRLGRPLRQGECVLRKKPDRMNNSWENLVVVQHALEKFKFLPSSRIIYVPERKRRTLINA